MYNNWTLWLNRHKNMPFCVGVVNMHTTNGLFLCLLQKQENWFVIKNRYKQTNIGRFLNIEVITESMAYDCPNDSDGINLSVVVYENMRDGQQDAQKSWSKMTRSQRPRWECILNKQPKWHTKVAVTIFA